jgi:hypothetical protein
MADLTCIYSNKQINVVVGLAIDAIGMDVLMDDDADAWSVTVDKRVSWLIVTSYGTFL